jgi:hypothetical protein
MKLSTQYFALALACFVVGSVAHGQITIDGTKDAGYGAAVSVQTVQTEFGDGDGTGAGGSELNAAYATVESGNLNLLLTGNIENNFNKLNIFIDSVAGGQNVIGPDTANGGVNPTNDGWAEKHNGLTFDTGFSPDYLIIARNGEFGGPRFDFDFNSVGNDSTVESSIDIFGGTAVGTSGLSVAFDNTNSAGVAGGTLAADATAAEAVSTGLELSIPLSALGNPSAGSSILISAHINGSNHDFLSNQILGGLEAGQGNLGGDGAATFTGDLSGIDFNNFAGDQFFSIAVPGGSLLGDFDNDGDVDLDDLDQYNGNIGQPATGALADLDLDGNGTVDAGDLATHFGQLVETSNGQAGTFAGDANLDGTVNVLGDAFTLVGNLNQPATSWAEGDFNGDGVVNVLGDAFALVGNLNKTNAEGSGSPSASAVPEPSSISLLVLGVIGVTARRKR